MKISGPFYDSKRRKSARSWKAAPKPWYLSYFAPVTVAGQRRMKRFRPYYETKEAANADKPRIAEQYGAAGTSAAGVLTRPQVEDAEAATKLVPGVPLLEMARFWRIHHPDVATKLVNDYRDPFLEDVKLRHGDGRHCQDLKARTKYICLTFGTRIPGTIERQEALTWLKSLPQTGRTIHNIKAAASNFFNFILEQEGSGLKANPFGRIRKRQLKKIEKKEIRFLSLPEAERYLRACERYDPELVAHEIIQMKSGVRADDEMADFNGDWVLPATREIVIPAAIAKTGAREVIDNLEENFWIWWKAYGRGGILRPKNYQRRWYRVRVLASIGDKASADEFAQLPVKALLKRPAAKTALEDWPWNARRRTFCTFHIAKNRSAADTALILRHRGSAETLHNSYRGLGATPEDGVAYFSMLPSPIAAPILPIAPAPRGIVRLQAERAKLEAQARVVAASASA